MSASLVLSIHSVHASSIYAGTKRFEYRTCKPVKKVEYIALYETGSIGAVTGIAKVVEVLEGTPEDIWERTKEFAEITREFFMSYFAGKAKAIAYRLGKVYRFAHRVALCELGVSRAPQSFQYITSNVAEELLVAAHQASGRQRGPASLSADSV